MERPRFTIEVCGDQTCKFLGPKLEEEITNETSEMKDVTVCRGRCRSNCSLAPNVYVSDQNGDEEHYPLVGRNKGRSRSKGRPPETTPTEIINIIKNRLQE